MMRALLITICLVVGAGRASTCLAGETGAIPQAELKALDLAISRELNSGNLGSQVLGDLTRLKNRLRKMQEEARNDKAAALTPVDGDDSQSGQLRRLEAEAQGGGRAARRTLALYYIYLNEPEKALAQWRLMGKVTDFDVNHLLVAAYLEFALGEYNNGRRNLESALRLIESRTSLVLSEPVFCQTIGGYRIYTPRPAGNLLPGEDVLLYVEVEGAEFTSARDGTSECDVMFGLKLKNETQSVIWAEANYGRYAPAFQGPIRDLHTALTWRIPNDLAPGRYHLHVEAVEELTKRRGESVIGFDVARRETNPEKRVTGTALPPNLYDMQKNFPGAPVLPQAPGTLEDRTSGYSDYFKQQQHELLQRHLQNQKVE